MPFCGDSNFSFASVLHLKDDVDLVDFNYFLTITPYFAGTASEHVTLAAMRD